MLHSSHLLSQIFHLESTSRYRWFISFGLTELWLPHGTHFSVVRAKCLNHWVLFPKAVSHIFSPAIRCNLNPNGIDHPVPTEGINLQLEGEGIDSPAVKSTGTPKRPESKDTPKRQVEPEISKVGRIVFLFILVSL